MPPRDDLDALIASDTEVLLGVATSLRAALPAGRWVPGHLAALSGALATEGLEGEEAWKSRHLATHLFGDAAPPDLGGTGAAEARQHDRVRADLAGMVPAGCGLHMAGCTATIPAQPRTEAAPTAGVTYAVALAVVRDLVATHAIRLGTYPGLVVMVGGTALAAHGVRATSEDVDVHMPEQDDAVVAEVEARHAPALGPAFRLDVTPSDTLWGRLSVRDIASMPVVATADVPGSRTLVAIRALDLPTLYVLKAAANRPKDVRDLRAMAPAVDPGTLLKRATTMVGWYGDRHRIVAFLDALVTALCLDLGMTPAQAETGLRLQDIHRLALAARRETLSRRRALAGMSTGRLC